MPPKTRHESGTTLSDVVGVGEPMLPTELPTLRGLLRHGIYLQVNISSSLSSSLASPAGEKAASGGGGQEELHHLPASQGCQG